LGKSSQIRCGTQNSFLGLLETIDRLEFRHQDRMIRIVTLFAEAPRDVQTTAERMLKRFLESPPQAVADGLAEIDALIDYLESNASCSGAGREAGRSIDQRLMSVFRYN
jgi:hypothetical protein